MKSKAKRTALVCEDNVDLNDGLREFLTELNFEVTCTSDGKAAVALIQSTAFQLILMDYRIPSMNGLQVCAVARATPLNRGAKIYVMTGDLDPSVEARAQALRVNRFIVKPFNMNDLEKSITKDFAQPPAQLTYDTKIVNVFLDAAAEIYHFYFSQQPQRGKLSVREPGEAEKGFCTGLIAFSGNGFAGSLGLGMTKPFVKQLSDVLFAGMNVSFDPEFLADVTGEMSNQIIGKVKINFAKIGIPITIGLPEVIMGDNHMIQHRVANPLVTVPIGRQDAVFELQFVLSQRDVKVASDHRHADVPTANVMLFE